MAEPQRIKGALSPGQEKLCRGFLEAALKRSAENLEMLLGQPLQIQCNRFDLEHDGSLRMRLPGSAVAFAVRGAPSQGQMLVVIQPPLARVLEALIRMAPLDDVRRAREDDHHLEREELDSLQDVGNFLLAGISDEASKQSKSKVELTPDGCLSLENSTWTSGDDPIKVGTFMVANGTIKVGDDEADPLLVAIPWSILEDVLAGLGEPGAATEAGAGGGGPSPERGAASSAAKGSGGGVAVAPPPACGSCEDVAVVGPSAIHDRVSDAVEGQDPTHFVQMSHLLAALESGARPQVIIAFIGAGHEEELEILGALRRHPSLKGSRFMVILDRPRRGVVMRCGILRLLEVLPADVDPGLFKRRLSTLMSRVAAPSMG